MATTAHLGITLVDQMQSQKEVTMNAALVRLDALLNTGAKSQAIATPPGSPASGDLYIVGTSPTGAWAGQAGNLVYFEQIWRFVTPLEGMTLWVNDEDKLYSFNGSSWVASSGSGSGSSSPYDIAIYWPSTPPGGSAIPFFYLEMDRNVVFPVSLSGSSFKATIAATSSTVFTLYKNGTSIGTITFAAGNATGTVSFTSAVTFANNDVFSILNQATADATLANLYFTIKATWS